MKNHPLHRISPLALAFALWTGCGDAPRSSPPNAVAETFPGRRIVVLRDRTASFARYAAQANLQIAKIVLALGPEDEFVVVDIGPDFDPARNVVVQCVMPKLSAKTVEPASNLTEWNQKQTELKALWKLVTANQEQMLSYFGSKVTLKPGGTDLEDPLLYAAKRLNADSKTQKLGYLIIFSDIRTERGPLRTSLPPIRTGVFTEVDVQVFMAPWNSDGASKVESEWRDWFVNSGRAKNFRMYDTAESLGLNPLPPNPAPKSLPSPFQTAGKD